MKRVLYAVIAASVLGAVVSCYDDQQTPPTEYAVTVTSGTGGSAKAETSKGIVGELVTLIATPESGYMFRTWAAEEEVLARVDSLENARTTLSMPEADVSIRAEFAFLYAIEVSAGEGGKAVADAEKAIEGTTVTLTATPEKGYVFGRWTTDETVLILADTVVVKPVASFTMPAADVSIRAEFEAISETEAPEED